MTSSETTARLDSGAASALTALVAGAVALGFSAIFVRLAAAEGIGPFASAFWRVALSLPVLYGWMRLEEARDSRPRKVFGRASAPRRPRLRRRPLLLAPRHPRHHGRERDLLRHDRAGLRRARDLARAAAARRRRDRRRAPALPPRRRGARRREPGARPGASSRRPRGRRHGVLLRALFPRRRARPGRRRRRPRHVRGERRHGGRPAADGGRARARGPAAARRQGGWR